MTKKRIPSPCTIASIHCHKNHEFQFVNSVRLLEKKMFPVGFGAVQPTTSETKRRTKDNRIKSKK